MSNQGGITFDNIDWIEVISKHPVNNGQVVSWRNRNINYSEYSFWTPWRKIITEGKVEYVLTEPTQNKEVGHSTERILRPKNIIINMDNLFFSWNIGYTDRIVYLKDTKTNYILKTGWMWDETNNQYIHNVHPPTQNPSDIKQHVAIKWSVIVNHRHKINKSKRITVTTPSISSPGMLKDSSKSKDSSMSSKGSSMSKDGSTGTGSNMNTGKGSNMNTGM